jgi:HEAT repeat protein
MEDRPGSILRKKVTESNANRQSPAWSLRLDGDRLGLVDLLTDEAATHTDRRLAARFLGEIGDATALDALHVALTDPFLDVRIAAASSLARVGDRESANRLAVIASSPDEPRPLREWAVSSLVALGDDRALALLVAELESASWLRRRWAAKLLGTLGDRRAIQPLQAARSRERLWRRWAYTRALRALNR